MQLRHKWIATMYVLLLATAFGAGQSTGNGTSTTTVPRLVKFSGSLRDDAGRPKTGIAGLTFALYKDQYGGAPLWLETQNVQADNKGNYTALLGATKPDGLPADLFSSNEARWLGVQPEGQEEQPRVLFVSVPYALKAADAETFGGKPISAFQLVAPQLSNSATQPAPPALEQANEITCVSGTACKSAFVPVFTSNGGSARVSNSIISQSGSVVTVTGEVVGQTGFFRGGTNGAIFQATQTNNTSGTAIGGVAEGTSGIGVQGAGVTGVLGQALANGTGVEGTGGFVGVEGQSGLAGGVGVSGQSTATSGLSYGVSGETFSSTTNAAGVLGIGNTSSGVTYGVSGQTFSSSADAAGVLEPMRPAV